MRESVKTALAVLSVVVLAFAFWVLLLSPKRDKVNELSEQSTAISAELTNEEAKLTQGVAAKSNFASLYARLVELGKAVPSEADTPSLLVQLQAIAEHTQTSFVSIALGTANGGSEASATTATSASVLPLGAAVGAAGLPAMPYTVDVEGGFFEIANFIHRLDSLVKTKNEEVDAKGRLVTIDNFTLGPVPHEDGASTSKLLASFNVTTYVAPTGEGLTAGATKGGPTATETEVAP